ncbi:uncharacterized protein LOC125480138 [Pyrus x bretschneideri]|uniref:uncharacterized protein LOC125480138 n=1 Tax=Pyrus x bretschneideri TaxID=225117 RepID=UPI002030C25D|nr:uncharacterized protein LOC125480138 [Pyrus x bretschneideri]
MEDDEIEEGMLVEEGTASSAAEEAGKIPVRNASGEQVYKDEYLREPNQEYLNRLLHKAEDLRFPCMIGSLDCMHWDWENCPIGWQGDLCGRSRKPNVVLEAVASYDTWIWHAFFGVSESQNDITVLRRSPFFNRLMEGKAPQLNYYINGHQYNIGYYLADDIYPKVGNTCPSNSKS